MNIMERLPPDCNRRTKSERKEELRWPGTLQLLPQAGGSATARSDYNETEKWVRRCDEKWYKEETEEGTVEQGLHCKKDGARGVGRPNCMDHVSEHLWLCWEVPKEVRPDGWKAHSPSSHPLPSVHQS